MDDPSMEKSKIDRENTDPNLAMPSSATDEPSREQLLRDMDEPSLRKSRTDIEDPSRAKLRKDTDAPSRK
jgi:hypothetical protein